MSIHPGTTQRQTALHWIKWKGGDCPISSDTIVEVRFRNGIQGHRAPAAAWNWHEIRTLPEMSIVAYRVLKSSAESAVQHAQG